MYRKNTAGQFIGFAAVKAADGTAMTGTTGFAAFRVLDGTQATATGAVTDKGNGQYSFALSQADTNGNDCSILFTMTGMIPVEKTFLTTACDPTDAVRFGLSSLPNAAAGASGGLPTADASNGVKVSVGTGTGQINLSSGKVPATIAAGDLATDSITAASVSAAAVTKIQVGLSTLDAAGVRSAVGLASANLDTQLSAIASYIDTEVAAIKAKTDNLPSDPADESLIIAATDAIMSRIGVNGAGLSSLGDARLAHLDADVSSRLATTGYTSPPSAATVAAATVDLATSGHTTAGTFGAAIVAAGSAGDPLATTVPGSYVAGQAGYAIGHNLDAQVSTRSTYAGGVVASVTAPVTLDVTQAIPTTNTPETLGDALNAARAQGFGKWVLSGTDPDHPDTLTLYAANGSTPVHTFTITYSGDNAVSRT